MVQADLMSMGRLFQSRGAATMKDRSPMVMMMMSQALISKIHCALSTNQKRDSEFNRYNICCY